MALRKSTIILTLASVLYAYSWVNTVGVLPLHFSVLYDISELWLPLIPAAIGIGLAFPSWHKNLLTYAAEDRWVLVATSALLCWMMPIYTLLRDVIDHAA